MELIFIIFIVIFISICHCSLSDSTGYQIVNNQAKQYIHSHTRFDRLLFLKPRYQLSFK